MLPPDRSNSLSSRDAHAAHSFHLLGTKLTFAYRLPNFHLITSAEHVDTDMPETLAPRLSRPRRSFARSSTAVDVVKQNDLSGKVFLITGATSGIGFETARALALRNGKVVMACRNRDAALRAKVTILQENKNASIEVLYLDCAELKTVEECAKMFKKRYRRLDCLILNAGVLNPLHRITDDGFEATFQVNYLAHFYLCLLLEPLLRAAAPSRVVIVSSEAHRLINLKPSQIEWKKLSPTHKHGLNRSTRAYSLSKLCDILLSKQLNKRWQPHGVTCNAVHPGYTKTQLARRFPALNFGLKFCIPFTINAEHGAATTVYCATSPDMEDSGGLYLASGVVVEPSKSARNAESAEKLWNLGEEMLGYYRLSVRKQSHSVMVKSSVTLASISESSAETDIRNDSSVVDDDDWRKASDASAYDHQTLRIPPIFYLSRDSNSSSN